MGRLIFILVIVGLIWWLLSSYRRKETQDQAETQKPQAMVSCSYCGVHLPKSEGVMKDGKYYCCKAHSEGRAE